ncbi:unnamed protein product, partial [Rotaria sordida]
MQDSKHVRAITFCVLSIIAMLIGILVVCFTSPKPPEKTCSLILKPLIQRSNQTDSHPHSIVVALFNDDNLLDIAVANAGSDNINILLAYGDGTFASQFSYSTGSDSNPHSLIAGDFNNDHRMDIAVANVGTHNIGVFLGLGNGVFTGQTTFSTGPSRPWAITVGDFNNDNKLDIAIANYGTNNIGVILGYGNGNFSSPTTFSTGYDSLPLSIAVGDFDNDNKLDIAVVNNVTNNVGIFLGHGNGSFEDQMIFTTVQYSTGDYSQPSSVVIDDFNNDDKLDIAVANTNGSNLGIFIGYGDGKFSTQMTYPTGSNSNPRSITVGDFNGDGQLDIAIVNERDRNIGVFLQYRNGTFMPQETYLDTSYYVPFSIISCDFDNDDRLDIAVAYRYINEITVLFGHGDGNFSHGMIFTMYSQYQPFSITVGDFNNDDRFDIAVANELYWYNNNVGVFLNYGNRTFSDQISNPTEFGSYPRAVTVGDFNNDGKLDIAVANFQKPTIGIFIGNGDGNFSSPVIYAIAGEASPISLTACDFNNDSKLDIVVANSGLSNVAVFLGKSNGTFSSPQYYSTGNNSRPYSVATGDLNNDNRLDIVVANSGSNNIGIFLGLEVITFTRKATYSTGLSMHPEYVAVYDLNNDTQLDIVVANSNQDN